MSSTEKRFFYNTILEINDESKEFIPYWNLTMQEHLSNNFVTLDTENNKNQIISLNSFNFKLIDQKDVVEYITNEATIQGDKFFTIDVYRIKKEKDFNNDYIKEMKQNYKPENISVVLYNIDDIKDNTIKNISKIIDKIKSKTGLNDINFIPYNEQNFQKFYSIVDNFFTNLKKKITFEYNNQLTLLFNKIYNKDKDTTNVNEKDIMYDYVKNKILYLDLLTIGESWDSIKKECIMDLFKVLPQLDTKFIFDSCSSDVNILEIKRKTKSKNLPNIEYQLFLVNHYMKSCRHVKDYEGLVHIMFNSGIKISLYKKYFESDYHYLYWNINYILNLINYSITFKDKINDIECKSCIEKGIIYLYTSCIKYMKQYAKLIKLEIPTVKLFMDLKLCIDKNIPIKEEIEKITATEIEENDIFTKFKSDIKNIDSYYFDLNKAIFDIFTNKKIFLEEYLHILQLINKKNCEYLHRETSLRHFFEIIPGLIALNKFEEAKNFLNILIQDKIFSKKKLNYTNEFLSLLLVMLLYCLEKNKDNLNLMFKLLDTNFTNIKYFLAKLECKDGNLINDVISKYIEAYNDKDNNTEKINKEFSLDKSLKINFEKHKDNIIFINKNKIKKEQIKYQITNNTGVNFNINKIQLIFEEFSLPNDSDKEKEKNKILYEIKENDFKNIEPYIKNKEHIFNILLEDNNDIFKLNTTYIFKQINFIINNILCGVYNVKEELKLGFNSIEMKVSTQVHPSYDSEIISPSLTKNFYYNTLSKINMNITDIPYNELNDKTLKINFEDIGQKPDTHLIIQTLLLKQDLIKEYSDAIIKDSSIEFPKNSLKEKSEIKILIPFYIENINFYYSGNDIIKITVQIIDKKDNNKIIYSYTSFHNINLIHLFNIKKKFRILKKNSFLMQSTFSLNVETSNIKVNTHNNNFSFYIDTTQAINLVILLNGEDEEIIKKLRQNFLDFSIEDNINKEKKENKYKLCYPEKNILEEIKELKEIPYYIKVDIENNKNDVFKELYININIKKNNKKKVLLMIFIKDNENWAVIGKSKIIEKWKEDNETNEKNIKVKILPLIDGFLKLPEIEFYEYEISDNDEEQIKINENDENKDELTIGKIKFDPIEYGTIIEGNEKVVNITPLKECSLKLNLT